ncbi:unnamed protein product [Effrenium voratum]|nr:unnamed protein product [Effrenium voratum]
MQMQPPQKWLGVGSLLGGLMAYRRQPACARNLSKVVRHLQGRSSISKQQVRTGSTAVVDIKDAIRNDLKQLNIDLEGLLPDSLQLLNSPKRGAVERGEKWEEMFANSLAARFRLLCIARNLRAEVTWVPFLEIYPTEDPHLRAVLEPFEVCWSDGVEYPSGEGNEATVMSDVGKAIKSNRNFATTHHDLVIPVRRSCSSLQAQCWYGEKKDAGGLKLQDKAKKDSFQDMQNVLLQICSESEGWQSFTRKTWARRQEEKKYSLMSCETIIAQLDVLKLL